MSTSVHFSKLQNVLIYKIFIQICGPYFDIDPGPESMYSKL